jgi:PHS family inorganic phosphate transporter-like MFS transporter
MDSGNGEVQLRIPLLPETAMSTTSDDNDDDNDDNDNVAGITREPQQDENGDDDDDAWFSNPHQLTAMLSNFSTSYNVVNISLVLPILEELYDGNSEDAAACASSLLAGMIIGQLVGGALGDSILGRLGALRLVMTVQIVASLASACVVGSGDKIYIRLAIWRFILGIGAGGVYPLAAVLSAEQGGKNNNSPSSSPSPSSPSSSLEERQKSIHRVVLTFSTQGAGFVMVPIVAVILLYSIQNLHLIWRIILGVGSLPGIVLMLLQWRLYSRHNSDEVELQPLPLEEPVEHVEEAALVLPDDEGQTIVTDDPQQRVGWLTAIRNEPGLCRKLIGTAGTWFLFDIVFYGNAIFQPIVVEAAFGGAASRSSLDLLRKAATDTLILTSIALPGYAVAGLVIGKRTYCVTQTPRYVMLQGFAAMSVLYFCIGVNWSYLRHSPALLVFLYGMTFFFANYGPNTCTFILPSLLYSPECRSTWNGISAASGKLGALFGATLFAPAADKWGDNCVMLICAGLGVIAFVLTYCFVPKEQEELEQLVVTEEDRGDQEPLNEVAM